MLLTPPGQTVARRDLGIYDRIGRTLAAGDPP
jgi:hypothetical protein